MTQAKTSIEGKASENLPGAGHNSKDFDEKIQKSFTKLADIDKQRKGLNDEASEVRAVWKECGLDVKGAHDEYMFWKRKLSEKEGYLETRKVTHEALDKMDQAALFGWMEKPKKDSSIVHASADQADAAAKRGESKNVH